MRLPQDFKEFLKLLKEHDVRYLLIGGYAVGFHGYPRATADMNIWVEIDPENANKIVAVLKKFGFNLPELSPQLFLQEKQIIRMGVPPVKLEICTSISGVEFEACYEKHIVAELDGVEVNLIGLNDLKVNKRASGRSKDLTDLEYLP
ncbi:MAG: hypothetical protein A2X25_00055 [Chloroflexi bacterium GWB2_49_20]|nr:MAG: hypothetical protein A2X25_00055 [Chloroflexi bacterium GWB2_49_20]OGN76950.1 MAG: hypothetical protein A2X26_13510 [Chloroflexi bacterium GWC2_49_37]OGN84929.1 MAG: hypothetical protein A2X27_14945 [Chloroflexi bacterium GWD2_49_16]